MTTAAVLDADVLYPMMLHDTLLRAAAAGCFRMHWSEQILDEVTRNLVETYGMEPAKAAALRQAMATAFPDADVQGWEPLEAQMANDPKDRHVAAAAVVAEATVIVTSNLRHFQALPEGVVALSPDQFLQRLAEEEPERLRAALEAQVRAYRRPPVTLVELLERLAIVAPTFAAKMASQ
ncbi:MAG: PIN domain-containing protein [Caulobacter sp.]|nr:PIN domain-containing protein [Caulobacter sp.]